MLFVVVFTLLPKADVDKEEQEALASKKDAKEGKAFEPADDDVD